MAKRVANTEINHENWDHEDEPEEAGLFRQADKEALKTRQIKKAKRRTAADAGDSATGTLGAFKGFTGFTSLNTKSPAFSFNTDSPKPLGGVANGSSVASFGGFKVAPFGVGSEPKPSFSITSQTASNTDSSGPAPPTKTESDKSEAAPTANGTGKAGSRTKYLQALKALNESVSKWIVQHVDKNAHCILTPIFKDYERHLADIEKLNPDESSTRSDKVEESRTSTTFKAASSISTFPASSGSPTSPTTSASIFGGTTTFKFTSSAAPASTSTTTSTGPALGAAGFSFGLKAAADSKKTLFSFATGGAAASSSSTQETKKDDDEPYEPPKAEVSEVKEEGAFYSKRCKLFYQKEGAWMDKGLGNLHLKTCGDKTQVIIRADTSLGNILLNIMLSTSLPMSRQGKNNVSMMCIANPPMDPKMEANKPISLLLKVKTAGDADELLQKMEENKK